MREGLSTLTTPLSIESFRAQMTEKAMADLVLPSIRDVLDIGESATDNPLPYDTIPARNYNLISPQPLPLQELATRLSARLDANPEFKYIREESARLKDRIDRNTVVINLAKRQQEAEENEARREKQDEQADRHRAQMSDVPGRAARTASIA